MDTTTSLSGILVGLIVLSACFSGSETGMMSINRYRLRHMKRHSRFARLTASLLERPDRLLGVILIGNTCANIFASSLATLLAVRVLGDGGFVVASLSLTLVLLIFAEITPKTVAAVFPERVAFIACYPLKALLILLYPLVWLVNGIANSTLRILGINVKKARNEHLSSEELKTVVNEAAGLVPHRHRNMLVSILDLERVCVEDIMVPKADIVGLDLADDWDDILKQLINSQHAYLPVYHEDIDAIEGVLYLRHAVPVLINDDLTPDRLHALIEQPYFVPESTPLHQQLKHFQTRKQRLGLVIDEYGDIQGLVTLEDILEEIVGEFTTDLASSVSSVHPQRDGAFVIDGSTTIRDLNKQMKWHLPTDSAKTLSGLVIERLESIPDAPTGLLIGDLELETGPVFDNMIKTIRVRQRAKPKLPD